MSAYVGDWSPSAEIQTDSVSDVGALAMHRLLTLPEIRLPMAKNYPRSGTGWPSFLEFRSTNWAMTATLMSVVCCHYSRVAVECLQEVGFISLARPRWARS